MEAIEQNVPHAFQRGVAGMGRFALKKGVTVQPYDQDKASAVWCAA